MSALPRCYGVIPARWGSQRFPGKPLALILGKPMIWHVHQQASQCPLLARVVLATDDDRILRAAREMGMEAVMTRVDHPSGTDRAYEAACRLGFEEDSVVVNVQGDEPALDPAMLTELLEPFSDPAVQITTLAHAVDAAEAQRPDRVKVVTALNGDALLFSRSPVPHGEGPYLGHVGLYAFRLPALRRFTELAPSPLERRERLEQLRLLENGLPLRVVTTSRSSHGVDRPEDIRLLESLMLKAQAADPHK